MSKRALARKSEDDDLRKRIRHLELRLAETEARLERVEGGFHAAPAAPQAAQDRTPTFEPVAMRPPTPPLPSPATHRPPAQDLERRLGASWLPKAGMVVLILGFVFFLRYAFDQGWINRPARIAMGVAGGLVLAAIGEVLLRRDRDRFDVYAQVLAGGGFVITYFSLFAAHAFPEYREATGFSLELSASLMWATGIALAAYAVYRNTPILITEALVLGTLASLYGNQWQPFSVLYLLALATAVGMAADRKSWDHVLAATVAASYSNLAILVSADAENAWWAVAAAGLLAVLFTLIVGRGRASRPEHALPFWSVAAALSLLGTWSILLLAFEQLDLDTTRVGGPTTIAFGAAAIALALAWRVPELTRQAWGLSGTIMVLAWPPIQFDGVATAIAWAGLAGLAAAVQYVRHSFFVAAALVAAGLLLIVHLFFDEIPKMGDARLDLGLAAVPFTLGAAAFFAAWWKEDQLAKEQGVATSVAMLAIAALLPVSYLGASLEGFQISIAWAALATVILVVGLVTKRAHLRMAALGMFALVLGRVFFFDLIVLDVVVRIITFLAVGALLLVAGFLYARRQRASPAATDEDPAS
ncbi:MAG TPA: DUF2339 domain-containing protein [Candidatus Thermoplasmatota archaeon]|nr:DUF2339 domain-containing protein [Candidatus Thermoplasmatota archaeon]